MAEEQVGLEISVEDLKALAEINPLAWAQLLHIADVRILKAKIAELEGDLENALDVNLINGNKYHNLAEAVIA